MKTELLILPFWLIAIYLLVLWPALLLAALTYRWNKGLLALVHNPEERADAPGTPLRAGLWLLRKSMGRLSPPWYMILAFLVLVFIVHAIQPDKVSTLHKLHWLGLHLSVEIAAILATISGTMLFSRWAQTPGELLWAAIIWVVGSWFVIWLLTPREIIEAVHKYHWGERNFTSVPTYPLVLPVYAVVMFVVCVYRTGLHLTHSSKLRKEYTASLFFGYAWVSANVRAESTRGSELVLYGRPSLPRSHPNEHCSIEVAPVVPLGGTHGRCVTRRPL